MSSRNNRNPRQYARRSRGCSSGYSAYHEIVRNYHANLDPRFPSNSETALRHEVASLNVQLSKTTKSLSDLKRTSDDKIKYKTKAIEVLWSQNRQLKQSLSETEKNLASALERVESLESANLDLIMNKRVLEHEKIFKQDEKIRELQMKLRERPKTIFTNKCGCRERK